MKKPAVLLTTAVAAVALAGLVGIGVASADSPSPSDSPTASSTDSPSAGSTQVAPTAGPTSAAARPGQGQHAQHRGLLRRALHGEVTLGGKKHRTVDFQRGTVSAVSGSSLTVRSADGFVGVYVVGSDTKVRVDRKPAAIGQVATGDRVRVVATKDGQDLTATRVADHQK